MFLKTKRFWKLLLLGAAIALISYFFFSTLEFAWLDFRRFNRYDWPRNLEYNSLFWIDMCFASVIVQILAACVMRWVRLLRNLPAKRKEITRKIWLKRFAILTVCVVLLTLIAAWRGSIYMPLIREQWDWAWVFANRYYPFVIADLFAIGAWVRWIVCGIRQCVIKLKEDHYEIV